MKTISVIITYCAADVHYLERCVASVLGQLSPLDELIVVYDGTRTKGEIPEWRDRNFQHVETGHQYGVSFARNLGASKATRAWLKFLDVDDVLAPFALDAMRGYEGIASILAGGMTVMRDGKFNREIGMCDEPLIALPDRSVVRGAFWRSIMRNNPALVSQCFIHHGTFNIAGGFDTRIHFEEDWDLWLRIHQSLGLAAFGYLAERVCYYCVNTAERAEKEKTRCHTVEGVDVRAYFRRKYGTGGPA